MRPRSTVRACRGGLFLGAAAVAAALAFDVRAALATDEAALEQGRCEWRKPASVSRIGFTADRDDTLDKRRDVIAALGADDCAVLCGVATGWRTLDRDAAGDPLLHEIVGLSDVACPWTVGPVSEEQS